MLLAGCNTDDISLATNAKANQPVPPKLVAEMEAKNMDLQSPMLVRLFKQEAELEVWKQDRTGRFALLKTYPICRWSGDLGPKVREGDRQAPEGFYSITPGQMNPQSAYYLSFNTGFPNAFDRALERTGSELMVHGDCSSRGCYAMTDEQIAEIYSLGRESFFGGQRAFQFQAYPFRMTPLNMARHRNNPNMAFWKMIKEGYDHFEVTRQEPKVDFCEKKYVFDAVKAPNATRDPVFEASAKCPRLCDSRRSRRRRARETGKRRGRDRQAGRAGNAGRQDQHRDRWRHEQGVRFQTARRQYRTVGWRRGPGAVAGRALPRPRHHSLPRQSAARARRRPPSRSATPAASTQWASAAPSAPESEGFFSSLARKVGLGGTADTTATAPPAAPAKPPKIVEARRSEPPRPPEAAAARTAAAKNDTGKPETRQAAVRPPLKPSVSDTPPAAASTGKENLVAGAQAIVPANSFDSRFSAAQ